MPNRSHAHLLGLLLCLLPASLRGGTLQSSISSVAVSPDGKTVAITFGKDGTSFIYKVPVDTGIAARLTDAKNGEESQPAFSFDGKLIAYSYAAGPKSHLAIVIGKMDGSTLYSWPQSEANDVSAVFCPNGRNVVFNRAGFYGNYSPFVQPHLHRWDFFQANLDGTDLHQITHEYFYQVSPPAVSPDGKNMAAVIETDDDPERIAIYSLEHREISARFLQPKIPGGSKHHPIYNFPNFLPDSETLVFMAASERLIGPFDYDIYQMNIETGAIERLTKGNGYATDLKVSADGKTAVFLKWHSDWHGTPDRSQLEILDLQTRVVTSLQIKGLD